MNPVKVNYFDMDMTPKEKAKELFNNMKGFWVMHSHSLKCAKVAVNQIIDILKVASDVNMLYRSELVVYWNEVLTELDNLKK